MRHTLNIMKSGIFTLILITWFSLNNSIGQTIQHSYRFFEDLKVSAPECGPNLTRVNNPSACTGSSPGGTFPDETTLCGAKRKVYHNETNWGLSYPNTTGLIGNNYTIQLYLKITDWGADRAKILGFSNGAGDEGLYLTKDPGSNERCLEFDSRGMVGDCPFFNTNNYYLFTVTRNGSTNELNIYVNDMLFFKYDDSALKYVGDTTKPIYIFSDDQQLTCESIRAHFHYLAFSNAFTTPEEVTSNFGQICYTPNVNSAADFSIAPNPSCGNQHNITITYTGSIPATDNNYDFKWDWDGGTEVSGSGRGPYVINWNTPGSKDVTLEVTNKDCPNNTLPNTKEATISTLDIDATFAPPTCTDANATVTVTAIDGRAPFQYSINATDYQSSATFRVPASSYKVYVKDDDECIVSKDIVIPFVETVTAQTIDDLAICEGESIQLETTSNALSFNWLPTTAISDPTAKDPVAAPTTTTEYTVRAIRNGCEVTDNVLITVVPKITMITTPDTRIESEVPFPLHVSSPQLDAVGGTYLWMPPTGLDNPNIANPTTTLLSDQIYTVRGTTPEGCKSEARVHISVVPPDWLVVPTAFTPNGDGINDVLKVITKGITSLQYLRIYNRWGQLVFFSTEIDKGWDGRVNGGDPVQGLYTYRVEGTTTKGKIIEKEGSVFLAD